MTPKEKIPPSIEQPPTGDGPLVKSPVDPHIGDYFRPRYGLMGWMCPFCHRVVSPYAQICPCNQMMPFGIPWC